MTFLNKVNCDLWIVDVTNQGGIDNFNELLTDLSKRNYGQC